MSESQRDRTEQAEHELEQWLVTHAEAGVPELVLIGVLRDYADDVEDIGYIPRLWAGSSEMGSTDESESTR